MSKAKEIEVSDKLISGGLNILGSLMGYYVAKEREMPEVPALLIGGLAGTFIADLIIKQQGGQA